MAERLELGRIVGNSIRVLRENLLSFTLLGLGLSFVPGVLAALPKLRQATTDQQTLAQEFFVGFNRSIGGGWQDILVDLIGLILVIAIVTAGVETLRGGRLSAMEALQRNLRCYGYALLVGLAAAIAVGLGLVLLIAPGLILLTMWCLVQPIVIVEQWKGFTYPFGKSRRLTRGSRWRILGIFALLLVGGIVLGGITGGAVGAVSALAFGVDAARAAGIAIGEPLVSTIGMIVGTTVVTVIYSELIAIKDGGGTQVADVFE